MGKRSPLGERLKKALEEAGIKGKEAAAAIGVPERAFYNWTMGLREPKIEVLEKMVKKLGLNPIFLLTGEGPPLLPREDKDVLAYTGKKNFLGRMKKSSWSDITVL